MVKKGGDVRTAGPPIDRTRTRTPVPERPVSYGEETLNVGDPPRLEALGATGPHSTRPPFLPPFRHR